MTGAFEGVGSLQFSPDNKFAYAYSGIVVIGDSEISLLDVKTQSEYIHIRWEWNYTTTTDLISSDDYTFFVYLNDVKLTAVVTSTSDRFNENSKYKIFLVPPFSNIKITAVNKSDSTTHNCYSSLIGKVYGAIEQENLESITDNNKWASL